MFAIVYSFWWILGESREILPSWDLNECMKCLYFLLNAQGRPGHMQICEKAMLRPRDWHFSSLVSFDRTSTQGLKMRCSVLSGPILHDTSETTATVGLYMLEVLFLWRTWSGFSDSYWYKFHVVSYSELPHFGILWHSLAGYQSPLFVLFVVNCGHNFGEILGF